jgi:hypothetical protein
MIVTVDFLSYVWPFILVIFKLSYFLLWFDLSLKKIKIWIKFLYVEINVLNKTNS